ncbi:MAG: cytochrome c [Halothiobacillaceae bacterium]|nr:cytochrome c [Halothiobacillaceae bacterium]HER35622.1 c-type cytochrome [Halothiobacillaceae bacterium]
MSKRRFIHTIGGVRDESFVPYERQRHIPVIVYSVVIALAVWGAFTLFTVDDQSPATAPAVPSHSKETTTTSGPDGASGRSGVVDGRKLFEDNCVTCHQSDGIGVANAVPPLAGSSFVTGPAEIPAGIVLMGLSGRLVVDGKTFDGRMPTFRNTLDNVEIARIVTYIRQAWGNDAGPMAPKEVAALRHRLAETPAPLKGAEDIASRLSSADSQATEAASDTHRPSADRPTSNR